MIRLPWMKNSRREGEIDLGETRGGRRRQRNRRRSKVLRRYFTGGLSLNQALNLRRGWCHK